MEHGKRGVELQNGITKCKGESFIQLNLYFTFVWNYHSMVLIIIIFVNDH